MNKQGGLMEKCVLLSIRPQYCELIASGKKTIEVRKNRPKLETPFKCYIYCTKGVEKWLAGIIGKHPSEKLNGKVIGEFVCDRATNLFADSRFWLDEKAVEQTCLTGNQIREYANGKEALYGWHISALQIYDKPKELSEFFRHCTEKDDCHKCIHWDSSYDNTYYEPPDPPFEGCRTGEKKHFTHAPMSWCYVEIAE